MTADRLSVRLPPKLNEQLAAIVCQTGKSESQIVREAIEEYCLRNGRQPTCFDLAEATGIIGCVKDAPKDLSSNPNHMRGFGSA